MTHMHFFDFLEIGRGIYGVNGLEDLKAEATT
jgi:hypothetical protein